MMKTNVVPIYGIDRLRMNTDGDGVRTLVCFQGCPLDCKYCINERSKKVNSKTKYYAVEQLVDELSIDSIYFQATDGGITFGGGEPLLYSKQIIEIINKCPSVWNYWIETSLNVPWENLELIYGRIDKFVVDIKSMNPSVYKEYTSRDNKLVASNLLRLRDLVGENKIIVRVPYIEGYTSEVDWKESIQSIKELGFKNVDVFKYRINNKNL